jgi:ribonuclease Z
MVAREFDRSAPVVVFDEDGLKVTAFPVKHDPVSPAVGYRFDYQGRSVLISGDTAYADSLVAAAKGVDVLIHEAQANHMVAKMQRAAAAAGNATLAQIFADIPSYHTTPEEAARAANEAGADWLVLTHLTPAPDNAIAKRIFMRGVAKVRPSNVKLAEDRLLISLPEAGGVSFGSL